MQDVYYNDGSVIKLDGTTETHLYSNIVSGVTVIETNNTCYVIHPSNKN